MIPPDPFPDFAPSRFRLIRLIGSGGMGVVYEAWDKQREIRTALKVLTGLDPDALYLFKNEFRSLADMSHPNLVGLHELFFEQGKWFFTMEFVEGGHFLEVVRPDSPAHTASFAEKITLGPNEPTLTGQFVEVSPIAGPETSAFGGFQESMLRSALGQLMQAVQALHDAGILHRDLKPANVKIAPDGRVVILDFGLAAHRDHAWFQETTAEGGLFGTVSYISPEQAKGFRVKEAADWYAVGVMLFEALTGRRPFEGAAAKILHDKQRHEAPPAEKFAIDIPEDLRAISAGLLARHPDQRMTGKRALELLRCEGPPRTGMAARPPQPGGAAAFVGREPQLAILRAAFAATESGAPCTAFVHGKSGIGKSALVEKFLLGLGARPDVVILAGRCYEQESMAYKALDSAMDALARYLAKLPRHEAAELMPRDAAVLPQIFPVLRRVDAIALAPQRAGLMMDQYDLRRNAFAALRELLSRLGDRRQVILCIDDLQWGDADSASLLREVLRGPEAPRLMLIGSYRDGYEDRSAFLQLMATEAFGDFSLARYDLPLGPLTKEECRTLATRLAGAEIEERVEIIAHESEGNPYFLQELAGGSRSGSHTLDAVLRDRVAALPDEARRLMELVAVSGRPLEQKEVFSAAGIEIHDPKLLAVLRVARLIGGAGNQIECYHDRVRETIVAHLDPATLRQHHASLAKAAELSGGDPEGTAIHFEGAGDPAQASRYYVLAAEVAAATLAFKHAATLYQRALDLSPLQGEPRRQLVVKLAYALANAGRGLEAARTYQLAAQDATEPEVFELERKVAYWFSASGYTDEGREALEKLLGRVGVYAPSPAFLLPAIGLQELQLHLRGLKFHQRPESQVPRKDIDRLDALWDATISFGIIDVPMAVYTTDRHLLLALKAGEVTRVARALTMGSVGAAALPVIGQSRPFVLLALLEKLSETAATPYIAGALHFTRAFIDFLATGRWKSSLAELSAAEQIFGEKCSAVVWEMSTIRIFSLWNLMYLGRYAELRRLAAVYTHDGEERGDRYATISIAGSIRPFAELAAGNPQQAMDMLHEALSRWTRRKYTVQLATAAYIRAWILLYQGDGAGAWEFLRGEWPVLRRHLYLHMSGTRQWLRYTRGQSALAVARKAANPAALLRAAEGEARRLERDPTGYTRPLAQLIRAGCAAIRGDAPGAARLLEAAVDDLENRDMAMMAAAARWRLGELLGNAQGASLRAEAEAAMKAEGVKQPASLAAVFVNGFGPARG